MIHKEEWLSPFKALDSKSNVGLTYRGFESHLFRHLGHSTRPAALACGLRLDPLRRAKAAGAASLYSHLRECNKEKTRCLHPGRPGKLPVGIEDAFLLRYAGPISLPCSNRVSPECFGRCARVDVGRNHYCHRHPGPHYNGGVASYYLLNRYAANLRNMADARALCQERIEDANTMTFRPSNGVVPLAPSADPTNTASKAILGAATYYSSTGAFTGGANFVTSTENIPVYTQSTGTAASNSANVTYTRKCTVTPEAYSYGLVPLNLVEFTVTVSYVFRGQTYTTSMSTMRGPD